MGERRIRDPIVLVGAPRSGTTVLFNALSSHPDLWSLYAESGSIIDGHAPRAMARGVSDVVAVGDIPEETVVALRRAFGQAVGNAGTGQVALSRIVSQLLRTPAGRVATQVPFVSRLRLSMVYRRTGRQAGPSEVRMVEKTPLNCLRVPLMERLFPDARFVYLTRHPRPAVASIYTGWTQSAEFRRFPFPPWFALDDYAARWWCFGLLPGWEALNGSPLMEVCAHQWVVYNQYCRRDIPGDHRRAMRVTYEDLVTDPGAVLSAIARWADLDPAPFGRFSRSLPVTNTRTNPSDAKWRLLKPRIDAIDALVQEEAAALGYEL